MMEERTQDLMVNVGTLLPLNVTNALNALGAIGILLVGLWLSGKADLVVVKVLGRTPHFDAMLKGFFGSLARYLVLTVTLLAVLSQFGIQTTSLVAVLGAAGLAVGLALQGTLSNLAAGVMLLIFRPFRIGHKVQVGGSLGTVKELSLFWTELITDEKVQIIVPNGGVWGQPLRNVSIYPAPPMPVRGASRLRREPNSSRQSKGCTRSSKPIRVCSPTLLRASCSIAARRNRDRDRDRILYRRGRDRGCKERSDQGDTRRARRQGRPPAGRPFPPVGGSIRPPEPVENFAPRGGRIRSPASKLANSRLRLGAWAAGLTR